MTATAVTLTADPDACKSMTLLNGIYDDQRAVHVDVHAVQK